MKQDAKYIREIRIHGLWGKFDVDWALRPDVNILSGINGVGKTTILNRVIRHLEQSSDARIPDGVSVTFDDPEAVGIAFDVIRSYDRPMLSPGTVDHLPESRIRSDLDWQLYLLQRKYLDYQVNIGNRMIELLNSPEEDNRAKAAQLSDPKRLFQDLVDDLFSYTGKTIDRKRNDIAFTQYNRELSPDKLSSGEKQILIILLTVLVRDRQACVLFMDEPEASLHIEWQQRLIGMIRKLNPNGQVIISTHSPAVIMEGWVDAVTEVSDISKPMNP